MISRLIADLAGRQYGVVARWQLLALGLSPAAIGRLIDHGRLHRLHHGVYAVGHRALTPDGQRMAAVLALGDGALASHATAAALWGLLRASGTSMHVTVDASRGGRSRAGITVHRPQTLCGNDVATVRGIPVTSVARTLADLGDVAAPRRVRAAFAAAERLRILDMSAVDAAISRSARRRGARVLSDIVRAYDPRWAAVRSGLELAVLDLIAEHGLPAPEVDVWVAGRYIADFLWRERRVIIEADSATFHDTPGARRSDARRDHQLRACGFTVVRVRDDELGVAPASVAARIARALAPTR